MVHHPCNARAERVTEFSRLFPTCQQLNYVLAREDRSGRAISTHMRAVPHSRSRLMAQIPATFALFNFRQESHAPFSQSQCGSI